MFHQKKFTKLVGSFWFLRNQQSENHCYKNVEQSFFVYDLTSFSKKNLFSNFFTFSEKSRNLKKALPKPLRTKEWFELR